MRSGLTFNLKQRKRRNQRPLSTSRSAAFSVLAHNWRNSLTAAQRDAWKRFASHPALRFIRRDRGHLDGRLAYLQENLVRRTFGIADLDDPPATPGINRVPEATFNWFGTLATFFVSEDHLAANEWYVASYTVPFPPTHERGIFRWYKQHFIVVGPRTTNVTWIPSPAGPSGQATQWHVRRVTNTARFSFPQVNQVTWS
jgi:hypothetical protein